MFKNAARSILTLGLVQLLLTGCATTLHQGKPFNEAAPPSPDQSLVYVFRVCTPPFYIDAEVSFNGENKMTLPNKGYAALRLPPGSYKVKIDWPALSGQVGKEEAFTFMPGKTHYVGAVSTDCNNLKALAQMTYYFGEWPEQKAREALNICTLADGSKNAK